MIPPRHTCVRNGEIICPDDLCRGSSQTLCGLEEGIDFGVDDAEDLYDWWDDEEPHTVDASQEQAAHNDESRDR